MKTIKIIESKNSKLQKDLNNEIQQITSFQTNGVFNDKLCTDNYISVLKAVEDYNLDSNHLSSLIANEKIRSYYQHGELYIHKIYAECLKFENNLHELNFDIKHYELNIEIKQSVGFLPTPIKIEYHTKTRSYLVNLKDTIKELHSSHDELDTFVEHRVLQPAMLNLDIVFYSNELMELNEILC